MFSNIKDWLVEDDFEDVPLADIDSIPDRIHSLIARNQQHPVIAENFLRIMGALDIVSGIQYHHDQYLEIILILSKIPRFAAKSRQLHRALNNEAVAYVNRVGQFLYFADSEFVKMRLPDVKRILPMVRRINKYRHKHTAHRSMDAPREGDTNYLQEQHAATFSILGGVLFHPKGSSVALTSEEVLRNHIETQRMLLTNYVLYQLQLDDGRTVFNFSVERDHPQVMSEMWDVMESLYSKMESS